MALFGYTMGEQFYDILVGLWCAFVGQEESLWCSVFLLPFVFTTWLIPLPPLGSGQNLVLCGFCSLLWDVLRSLGVRLAVSLLWFGVTVSVVFFIIPVLDVCLRYWMRRRKRPPDKRCLFNFTCVSLLQWEYDWLKRLGSCRVAALFDGLLDSLDEKEDQPSVLLIEASTEFSSCQKEMTSPESESFVDDSVSPLRCLVASFYQKEKRLTDSTASLLQIRHESRDRFGFVDQLHLYLSFTRFQSAIIRTLLQILLGSSVFSVELRGWPHFGCCSTFQDFCGCIDFILAFLSAKLSVLGKYNGLL